MESASTAWIALTLTGELLCLLLAAPALYFSNWFPTWALWLSVTLLGGGWLLRRGWLGCWLVRTPADWPMFFLFAVMVPVAVWAAPEPLRAQYSIPRALILVWNFCLFWTVVTYASQNWRLFGLLVAGMVALTTLMAGLAMLGINWTYKFAPLKPIVDRIPSPLLGLFSGAESGFSPNQMAGALLYVLPLLLTLLLYASAVQRRRPWWWLGLLAALEMSTVLVLTQSRAGLLGFGLGLAVILLLPWRWGRYLLVGGSVLLVATAAWWLPPLFNLAVGGDATPGAAGVTTLTGRQEIWERALYGIHDFVFTGMGLGTFREIVNLLYPLFTIPPDYDIAHAHNFFLQTGLDFGLPGLIALLAIYIVAIVQVVQLWLAPQATEPENVIPWRIWSIGFTGVLVAQTVYSQLDAAAMGSKPNFLFWFLLALLFGAASLTIQHADL